MYCCINPGEEELTAKERGIYSLRKFRMTRNSILCVDLEEYYRTLTRPEEKERFRLLPPTPKATRMLSKLQCLLLSVAAMAQPFDQ